MSQRTEEKPLRGFVLPAIKEYAGLFFMLFLSNLQCRKVISLLRPIAGRDRESPGNSNPPDSTRAVSSRYLKLISFQLKKWGHTYDDLFPSAEKVSVSRGQSFQYIMMINFRLTSILFLN